MSNWWTKYPLPEGWEAKYHWDTKRFFYVDHINKKTAWVDPRIELYKKAEGILEEIESLNDLNSESDSPKSVVESKQKVSRENKAKAIQQKYPQFPLEKIIELLKSNYDNDFSVESKINQELRSLEQLEQADIRRKEIEDREKMAAADHQRREKEDANRRLEETRKEETRKKLEEEKIKLEEAMKRKEDDARKRQEEQEKKRREEENKKRAEEIEKKIREEETKKRNEEIEKRRRDDEIKKRQEQENILKSNESRKSDKSKKESKNEEKKLETKKETDKTTASTSGSDLTIQVNKGLKSSFQRGSDKLLCSGPNPHNYKGPNNDLRAERVGSIAKGPDPLNRCGPLSRSRPTVV